MGTQSSTQSRRYQSDPIVCCGADHQPLPQQSGGTITKPISKYHKSSSSQNKTQTLPFQQTGSTYYNQKDISIFRRPQNTIESQGTQNNQRDANLIKPITQQDSRTSQDVRKGFASFKKYGAFNKPTSQAIDYPTKEQYKSYEIKKPTPMVDYVMEKDISVHIQNKKERSMFVGQGKYSGRVQDFTNNKRIIQFLHQNHMKDPSYKFYDTTDTTSLLNNSTIGLAKSRQVHSHQQQSSTSQITLSRTLSLLQQPIELTLQIDSRIILATCLLIIGIVVVLVGGQVIYTETNFFVCMIVGIVLYVCYLIMCYIYNDVFQYMWNTRSFDEFQTDFKQIIKTNGQLAYHMHLDTGSKVIKQCYLLSKENKFNKILEVHNENRDIELKDLKDKRISYLMVKYKTKCAFTDPQSQLNTIHYFQQFVEQQKRAVSSSLQPKKPKPSTQPPKPSKFSPQKQENLLQSQFKNCLKKSNFSYELDPIPTLNTKPQSTISVCYKDDDGNQWFIAMFVLFTLIGLCLPFLCIFQAYTKRQFIKFIQVQDQCSQQVQSWMSHRLMSLDV